MMKLMRLQISYAHNVAASRMMNTSSRWQWYLAHDCFTRRIRGCMETLLITVSSIILTERYVQEI